MHQDKKYENLLHELRQMKTAMIAFSGGVDSTFLLHAAMEALGEDVLAVTLVTPYIARAEVEEAKEAARTMKARHRVVEMSFPEAIRDNPSDHCYICKRQLFSFMVDMAAEAKIDYVLEGTNTDDLNDYRPGLRALQELGIESPLRNVDMTKQEIRSLSKLHGLPSWDKPSGACLLSRIPIGSRVEESELRRIEQAELFLQGIGFTSVRLRSHGEVARIEVPAAQVLALVDADRKHGIDGRLKTLGYRHVAVDLAGYRMGSLNEHSA